MIKKKNINCIINEFLEMIIPIFGDKLKKVILYGSYARGDFLTDSDIDIIILVDETAESIKKYDSDLVDIDVELNLKHDVVLSTIVQDICIFNRYSHVLPFYANIQKEGVIYYEQ